MGDESLFPAGTRVRIDGNIIASNRRHLSRHARKGDVGTVGPDSRYKVETRVYVTVAFDGCPATHRFLPEELVEETA